MDTPTIWTAPYGFDPAAAAYDARLQEILASNRLDFFPLADLVEVYGMLVAEVRGQTAA